MIQQSTVLVCTPLALELDRDGIDISERVSDIVTGLNDTTANISGFTLDNIAVDLPDYTKNVPEHTDVLDVVSTKLAEIIRGSLYTISKYTKPVLVKADEIIRQRMQAEGAADLAFSYLKTNQIDLEPEFLASAFVPTEYPVSLQGTTKVNVDKLLLGNWPVAESDDQIFDMIYVDSDLLRPFFEDRSEIRKVYESVFVHKNWWSIFDSRFREGGVVDVQLDEHYMNFSKYRSLVIANLIINRLVADDSPMPGVTGVSLNDYRLSLGMVKDVLAAGLYRFKMIWAEKAAAGIVILDDNVKYKVADWGPMEGKMVLEGVMNVGYNRRVLELFAESESGSVMEAGLGYVYAKQRGYKVKDVITDAEAVNNAVREYYTDLELALRDNLLTVAKDALATACREVCCGENWEPILGTIQEEGKGGAKVFAALCHNLDVDSLFYGPLVNRVSRGEDSLMNSSLAVELCKIFGSELGAEILQENLTAEPGPKEHQRKVLAGAMRHALIKRLVK
ncbi:hypothetical protein CF8_0231 [Aeromonas phage CF8]|nr:hypothetical protein CF8_0231 [Aeromonas phage CF8]